MSKNCQRMLLCGNKILRIDLHNPKINYRKSVCVAYSPRLDTLLLEQHFSKFNRYYRITRKEYDSFDSLRTEEMIDKFITEAANTGNLLFSTNPEDNNVIHQKMLEKINEENYNGLSSDNYQKKQSQIPDLILIQKNTILIQPHQTGIFPQTAEKTGMNPEQKMVRKKKKIPSQIQVNHRNLIS